MIQGQQNQMVQITFEKTPNPATIKFIASKKLTDKQIEATDASSAQSSPLALKIFGFPWTSSVFVADNFITVTKQDWVEWDFLAQPLAQLIANHINAGEPVIVDFVTANSENVNDSEIVKQIKAALDREIRPVVAMDGGDIVFNKFENQILWIHMRGACSGCPSSTATLKQGIEVRMKELFPEINEVRAV